MILNIGLVNTCLETVQLRFFSSNSCSVQKINGPNRGPAIVGEANALGPGEPMGDKVAGENCSSGVDVGKPTCGVGVSKEGVGVLPDSIAGRLGLPVTNAMIATSAASTSIRTTSG
jgi:hypothetical protein